MGSYKDLVNQEGRDKFKELVESAKMCMFATNLDSFPISARPMGTLEVDDDGNLWFFSQASSEKNYEIKSDSRVQLFFNNTKSSEYLSVAGIATIIKDEEKAKELWTVFAKTWFNEGVDDPELSIIKVEPQDIYYWDTKTNRVVSLLKIAVGALTGKTMDGGVEGKIVV
ncbi:MAG: pyridoxamine 5'-phosphate oxidase family protein [Bacteroidota bacterium]|nr:pyridoxamine 5'-phosphate oxidase family protein [Ferruginibacter sp.]